MATTMAPPDSNGSLDQQPQKLPTTASGHILQAAAGFEVSQQVTHEELLEEGMKHRQYGSAVVQQHIREVLARNFSSWIARFGCLLFWLKCMFYLNYIKLVVFYIMQGSKCHGPLYWWASVFGVMTCFNGTLNIKSDQGSWMERRVFRFDHTAGQQMPLYVNVYNVVSRHCVPIVWVLLLLYWLDADGKAEKPCKESSPALFYAQRDFAVFAVVHHVAKFFGAVGLPGIILRYAMTNGVLRSSHAADPEVIKSCQMVPMAELEEGAQCSICLENYTTATANPAVRTSCKHMFHKVCLKHWLQVEHTCPLCRQDFATAKSLSPQQVGAGQVDACATEQ